MIITYQGVEFFKVQFLAACKTETGLNFIAAFYLRGDEYVLTPYVIQDSSDFLEYRINPEDQFYLVDYDSYLEMCEITNESKLDFFNYFNVIRTGSIGINTLVKNGKDSYMNYDIQKELNN